MVKPITFDFNEILANSFRNFHAKGMDYVCLVRTPYLTVKGYIFEDFDTRQHAVVNPHDHRYDFSTEVVAGEMTDETWRPARKGEGKPFDMYHYRTPLNGGNGFTKACETWLKPMREVTLTPASPSLETVFTDIHTIKVRDSHTILRLHQYHDRMPLDEPSRTFVRGTAPTTDGLYDRFTPDLLLKRLELMGVTRDRLTGV